MLLAKVRGTVVSTCKEPTLSGVKFLLVQLLNEAGELLPEYEVAADVVGAGNGEWVLISRGSGARQHEGYFERPLDATIVAIVDTVSLDGGNLYSKREDFS
ncbi:Carbon dioxide concentrating mechanism protein [Halomicronema hongdechloris C2206]|uniref:Carboxysome shell vertex protein CcmL n=1 Tax=Halomicronema hongdechloris C2206 TaxID=1641165 RepID=A0A1Z3HK61_9CYAN|nr:EutN/CcmL family microcompartment protein [Halomicronema hongdechloris]ASC70704.1 Carbon dioxide concentrating mechanism protein [Halomicronema hongdechloris C2206]